MNKILINLIDKVANKQDKLAFAEIFDYFAPRIIGYFVGSGSSKEMAEELAQEVLSVVWQKADQFQYKKGNVATWVFTIARNKRIDRIRKDKNPTLNPQDIVKALYQNDDTEINDLNEKITQIQLKLNENEKKLIKMNFFEGKSHKIIAQDLEIPLGTVKSKIRNILTKMKK